MSIEYGQLKYAVVEEEMKRVKVENIYNIMHQRVLVREMTDSKPTEHTFEIRTEQLFSNKNEANEYLEAEIAMNNAIREPYQPYELSAQEIEEERRLEWHLNEVAGLGHLNYEE